MGGTQIVRPIVLVIMILVVAIGYGIMRTVVEKKWGYTKKREEEIYKGEEDKDFLSK